MRRALVSFRCTPFQLPDGAQWGNSVHSEEIADFWGEYPAKAPGGLRPVQAETAEPGSVSRAGIGGCVVHKQLHGRGAHEIFHEVRMSVQELSFVDPESGKRGMELPDADVALMSVPGCM